MNTSTAKPIHLVLVTSLDSAVQQNIRAIRNEENIRKWMYSDHEISKEEHANWLNNLELDERQVVFAVMDDEQNLLGVISANAIDQKHKKCDWAYYLTEAARGGLGSALEYVFIDFIFDALGMEKLNCEVIEGNDAVVKLHKKFLFQEEGFRRSNILKNGERKGVHFLGLTKADWQADKQTIQEKYKSIFERFTISIQT